MVFGPESWIVLDWIGLLSRVPKYSEKLFFASVQTDQEEHSNRQRLKTEVAEYIQRPSVSIDLSVAVQQSDHGWEEAVPEPVCACVQASISSTRREELQ